MTAWEEVHNEPSLTLTSKSARFLLTAFVAVIAIQMIRIQTSTHAAYLDKWAQNYGVEVRTVQSERGYIYDRWGHLLAGNKEVYEIGAELQYVKNPASIASAVFHPALADYDCFLLKQPS